MRTLKRKLKLRPESLLNRCRRPVTTAYKTEIGARGLRAATFGCYAEIARPRSAAISSTLNTGPKGCQPSKRSQFDGRKFERSRKSSIPGIRTIDSNLLSLLCFSFSSILVSLCASFQSPFGFLRHDFQLQFRIDGARFSMLWKLLSFLSLFLSQSAVDFLVHRPNFPGRYGQFNTRVFPPLRHARLAEDHFFSAYRGIRVRTDF